MLRADKPLWLPEGSIRAVLALVLVIAAVVASFIPATNAEQFLWPAATGITGFYFGQAPKRQGGEVGGVQGHE